MSDDKINKALRAAADAGILPRTIEDLFANSEHYHEQVPHLADFVADFVARLAAHDEHQRTVRAKRFRNTGNKHRKAKT